MQLRLGANENLSVEGAVGLLAVLGAEFQIAVDALAKGAFQFRRSSSLEMNHVAQPGDGAGKCFSPGQSRLVLRDILCSSSWLRSKASLRG